MDDASKILNLVSTKLGIKKDLLYIAISENDSCKIAGIKADTYWYDRKITIGTATGGTVDDAISNLHRQAVASFRKR